MARLYLLIDGYNLMHAAGLGRSVYGPGELERNRQRLVSRVASALDEQIAANALVVFDAHLAVVRATDEEQALPRTPLTVRFSRDGRDADAEIELILETHSSPRQILIVSSDHRLHKAASRRKARCIDSEDFLRQLDEPESLRGIRRKQSPPKKTVSTKRQTGKSTEKIFQETQQARAAEAEDYLEDFLMIDVGDIKRSVRKEKF